MLDRLLAIISIALITAFCALLVSYVGRIDLGIVIGICLLIGAFDLLFYSFRNTKRDERDGSN